MDIVKRVLLSWSSGKDSAYALLQLRQSDKVKVVGLITTVNEGSGTIPIHETVASDLHRQAQMIGLPLVTVGILQPCPNEEYRKRFLDEIRSFPGSRIDGVAFGDLFLEDIREFRENLFQGTGIEPLFPLWGIDTARLAEDIIESGIVATITSVDASRLSPDFIGRKYDMNFLNDLPSGIDPCGENGEFHTFVERL